MGVGAHYTNDFLRVTNQKSIAFDIVTMQTVKMLQPILFIHVTDYAVFISHGFFQRRQFNQINKLSTI
jgi:hypothetical protein